MAARRRNLNWLTIQSSPATCAVISSHGGGMDLLRRILLEVVDLCGSGSLLTPLIS